MKTLADCLYVGVGGMLGSICRYLMSLLPIKHQSGFPLTTLCINVIGALVIGIIVALAGRDTDIDPRLLLFLKVGLCGGFTTFSTFSHETTQLLQNGKIMTALLYMVLSVILCVSAVAGMQALVK